MLHGSLLCTNSEKEKKETKRQRLASTTPRSTSGTLPHEYDMVMGIAPVEPQELERFEEGNNSDFQIPKLFVCANIFLFGLVCVCVFLFFFLGWVPPS